VPNVEQFWGVIFSAKKASNMAMGKAKQLSLEEKNKIMCWAAEGVKTKQIATRLGCSERAIRMHLSVLKSLLPNATPPPPKARSGRPS
jgi:DNA-binding NarL/FixJ family response regulator